MAAKIVKNACGVQRRRTSRVQAAGGQSRAKELERVQPLGPAACPGPGVGENEPRLQKRRFCRRNAVKVTKVGGKTAAEGPTR